eukprot:994341-Pelagomonas_calceolata.AAC.4
MHGMIGPSLCRLEKYCAWSTRTRQGVAMPRHIPDGTKQLADAVESHQAACRCSLASLAASRSSQAQLDQLGHIKQLVGAFWPICRVRQLAAAVPAVCSHRATCRWSDCIKQPA